MPMFNLLEYRKNYSMTSGSLCNYYREEIDNIHDNASDSKSFKYKTKIVGKTAAWPGNEGDVNRPAVSALNLEVTIPVKYLSNVWRFLDLPLINCEIELDLSWEKECVLIEPLRKKCPNTEFLDSIFLYLDTEIYGVNPCIQSEYRKIPTRKNSVFGRFSRSEHHNNITGVNL